MGAVHALLAGRLSAGAPKSQSREVEAPRRHDYERIPAAAHEEGHAENHDPKEEPQEDDDGLLESLKDIDGDDFDLPNDVYGALIFSAIHDSVELFSGKDHDSLEIWINWTRVLFVATSVVFNYVLQLSVLSWSYKAVVAPALRSVQKLYQEYHRECFDADGTFSEAKWEEWDESNHEKLCGMVISSFWFLYLMLCLWWMTMLNEFRKTDKLARHLWNMPTARNYSEMIDRSDADFERAKRIMTEVRIFLFVILIVPKHIVSVGLLILGTWWLTATESFGELILNALALGFVIEIDELMFEAMFPDFMEASIAKFKLWSRVDPDPKVKQRVAWEFYQRSAVVWVVILLGVYCYLSFLQGLPYVGVLPGYKADTHPCKWYWQNQTTMICKSYSVWKGAQCFPYGQDTLDDLPPHPELYAE